MGASQQAVSGAGFSPAPAMAWYHVGMARKRHAKPGHNADNDALSRKGESASQTGATVPSRGNRRGEKMDYVNSGDRPSSRRPQPDSVRNAVQDSGPNDPTSLARSVDVQGAPSIAREMYRIRRAIHNELGRLAELRETVATIEARVDSLREQDRQLARSLLLESPLRLLELNEATRKWRKP